MIINQNNIDDLRDIFCNAIVKIFGNSLAFIDFLENEGYSSKYDCFIDPDGENYIINTHTGDYINWYKLHHIGRCINISTFCRHKEDVPIWIEKFLAEFKEDAEYKVSADMGVKAEDVTLKAIMFDCTNRLRCKGCRYLNNDTIRCRLVGVPAQWRLE